MKSILTLLLLLVLAPALAHDHEHPELNSWYQGLRSNVGHLCCDGADAVHLADVDWRTTPDGHYQVRVNQFMDDSGEFMWVDVPDAAVVTVPNHDGRTLVWPIWGSKPNIRCFLPGTMS